MREETIANFTEKMIKGNTMNNYVKKLRQNYESGQILRNLFQKKWKI